MYVNFLTSEGMIMNTSAQAFFDSVKGKTVAFIGIGTSNLPLIRQFAEKGAEVIACDRKDFEALGENGVKAKEYGAELLLGDDYLKNIKADIVFRSPGTPFYKEEPTTIIAEILKTAGKTVHLGGNIGKPLWPDIESVGADDWAVVELSSFQLISMRQSPDIAVVTNLAPNHLDIHKDMQEYVDAKKNIVLHQSAFGKAVLNLDNAIADGFSDAVRGQLAKFSVKEKLFNGAYLDGTKLVYSDYGKITEIMDYRDIKIPGMHNVENYLAAIAAVWGIADVETIVGVAKSFGGVAHRAEFVREVRGVKYYNDSIASSPTRTALGTLSLYDEKIIIIAGGYDKHIPYEPLGPVINNKVKTLILLGDTAPKIEAAVKGADNYDPDAITICTVSNMEEAVAAAAAHAQAGDIVSLSPASASFGLYRNFEERGNHFKQIVNHME